MRRGDVVVLAALTAVVGLPALAAACEAFRATLAAFDPAQVTGAEARQATELLVSCERAVGAARLAAALRAGECNAFPAGPGVGDAADWLAQVSGSSRRQAGDELKLAHRLQDMPGTRRALEGGEVSTRQAMEIAATEAEVPGSETDLLALAKRSSLHVLQEQGRERRLAALDPAALAARQRKARFLKHWTDELGMVRGSFALEPIEGTAFVNRLDAETDRRVRAEKIACNQAVKEGQLLERDTRDQHAADALLGIVQAGSGRGGVRGKSGRADVVLVGDIRTVLAGDDSVGAGCKVVGGSPVPVETFRQRLLSSEVMVKAVAHDGIDLRAVQHIGRRLPAELRHAIETQAVGAADELIRDVRRAGVDVLAIDTAGRRLPVELKTAIELGEPGRWDGYRCSACGRRHGVELDHVVPICVGGRTSYRSCRPLCWVDHQHKTARDRAAGLLTPPRPGNEQRPDVAGSGGDAERGPP